VSQATLREPPGQERPERDLSSVLQIQGHDPQSGKCPCQSAKVVEHRVFHTSVADREEWGFHLLPVGPLVALFRFAGGPFLQRKGKTVRPDINSHGSGIRALPGVVLLEPGEESRGSFVAMPTDPGPDAAALTDNGA